MRSGFGTRISGAQFIMSFTQDRHGDWLKISMWHWIAASLASSGVSIFWRIYISADKKRFRTWRFSNSGFFVLGMWIRALRKVFVLSRRVILQSIDDSDIDAG